MADRNSSSIGSICRNSLFCLLIVIASIFSILSGFFVLCSTSLSHYMSHNLLLNSKYFAIVDSNNSREANQYETKTQPLSSLASKEEAVSHGKYVPDCGANIHALKVFMYDLPPEFHFGLLDWKAKAANVWPDIRSEIPVYPGGLNLQHSIEYWLTLDLLSSGFSGPLHARAATRVHNSSEADVIFVPFFSSLSYNRFSKVKLQEQYSQDKMLQEKLVKFLQVQEEWKRSGGLDHVIMAHHPNSMLEARNQLWPAMFILSDFGRYPPNIANVQKDVIAPYKHVIKSFVNDMSTFDSRPILLYFQGAIYRKDGGIIRQELFYLLKDEKDVHFAFGSIQRDGIKEASQGMHSSKFCLSIAGDTPSSNRLFDAIASHCVPVIISDDIELPFEDVLDYSEFCIFISTSDAINKNYIMNLVRGIRQDDWTRMWKRLKEVEKFFEFQYPSREDDAVQMIWQAVARKVPAVKLKLHRCRRFPPTADGSKEKERAFLVPGNFW
ncbi:hypothetical protein Nepgr_031810 [Nepenthes gracilis]|uniref:Exostosin GT47 domain-containing protein n=1 Tax=Nepenthes gracilis TaxID=150966 RepID=A0AAD3Y553_NEPGR|nr:hypothetical protein Nepgr_031810 [Nepenthes gracilis]